MQFPSAHCFLAMVVAASATRTLASEAAGCALNHEYYRAEARTLAQAKPGARLDNISVYWNDPLYGDVSVTIGGCNHLGLRVTSRRSSKQEDPDTLSRFAAELIAAHWPKPYVKNVTAIFRSVKPVVQRKKAELMLSFETMDYDELIVIERLESDMSEVEVFAVVPT